MLIASLSDHIGIRGVTRGVHGLQCEVNELRDREGVAGRALEDERVALIRFDDHAHAVRVACAQ